MGKIELFFCGIVVGMIMSLITMIALDPYKQGQIDSMNGVLKYKLVEQADKSIEWERLERYNDSKDGGK